ncbi:hypothetical protein [Luteolibacter sp. Populi]|uniref:hypothetical protein n=1 Tax=Luteolibacter sp. Populi TaxID=3230487 RepID=UPI0034655B60
MKASRAKAPAAAGSAAQETATAPQFAPPRCAGSPAKCRIGDWEYPAFIFEWWGLGGVQRYQPGRDDPFDTESFDPAQPVWLFERSPHPAAKFRHGHPCDVWKRIA